MVFVTIYCHNKDHQHHTTNIKTVQMFHLHVHPVSTVKLMSPNKQNLHDSFMKSWIYDKWQLYHIIQHKNNTRIDGIMNTIHITWLTDITMAIIQTGIFTLANTQIYSSRISRQLPLGSGRLFTHFWGPFAN
jgi:hypothetical protein